ncbi:MAG TPA: deoxyribodipyrimidine photo-lyase [Rhizobiales bacterium]|nr:deoxyribodipyrimidine photo-lyase [Hyphomicrobiales bacterium]
MTTLVLFRHDLRIADNRALAAAAARGAPVLPVFVLDEVSPGTRRLGGARRWWVHHSLTALAQDLARLGSPLVLRRGAMAAVVDGLVAETGADAVFWNRRYDPAGRAVDAGLKESLRRRGLVAESSEGQLAHEPSRLRTAGGGPFRVFTPFWKAFCAESGPRDPVDAPVALFPPESRVASEALSDWALLPVKPDWARGLAARWTPGEAGARKALESFIEDRLAGYADSRDVPGGETTSRLSPHLAHGEITPRQILAALDRREIAGSPADREKFRRELGWREFSWHLLFHNPDLGSQNFNRAFDAFPWTGDSPHVAAWRRGRTGYPIVDAGMRELWRTGWMHNRVRMVVASFLTKHLLADWRQGEAWFWDTLVDADLASNAASWQWVAGSGADAAPYFRIFNPVLQGEKFDPDGAYVRHHVPELAKMPPRFIHRPWEAPADVLFRAGVKLGETYPVPVVDHEQARRRALAAFETARGQHDDRSV